MAAKPKTPTIEGGVQLRHPDGGSYLFSTGDFSADVVDGVLIVPADHVPAATGAGFRPFDVGDPGSIDDEQERPSAGMEDRLQP